MIAEPKTALVTGVSGGLGGGIARSLLADGWLVFGLSRTKPDLGSERFSWFWADLAKPAELEATLVRLDTSLDAIIHAAGAAGPVGPGLGLPIEGWRETFEVNFFAPLVITERLADRLQPNACVIFFSGGGAAVARPLVGPYAVSKLAVVKLAEQFALEYPTLRFYAIAPGAHDTKLFREHQNKTGEIPRFAEFTQVDKLIRTFLSDTERRLNGKLVHIRDDIGKLLSVPESGTMRRIEAR